MQTNDQEPACIADEHKWTAGVTMDSNPPVRSAQCSICKVWRSEYDGEYTYRYASYPGMENLKTSDSESNDQELEAILERVYQRGQKAVSEFNNGYQVRDGGPSLIKAQALAAIQAHYNRKFDEAIGENEVIRKNPERLRYYRGVQIGRNEARQEARAKWYGEEKPH